MLVIIGPSASGKTQIVNTLIKFYKMRKMVTYTTRPIRNHEVNGIDYYFINKEEFLKKIKDDFFLEYVCYNGYYYGTANNELSSDKVVIVEKEGLKAYIKKAKEQIKIVFIRCSKPIRRLRMIERDDVLECINARLIYDDEIFNDEVRKLADLIIDTSNSNVFDDATKIYEFYKNYI